MLDVQIAHLSKRLANIRSLHAQDQRFAALDISVCVECGKTYPCPTMRVVGVPIEHACHE